MKTWDIIGYAYEADVPCTDCAEDRFGVPALWHGTATDREGNEIHPIFASDESQDDHCGDCGAAQA